LYVNATANGLCEDIVGELSARIRREPEFAMNPVPRRQEQGFVPIPEQVQRVLQQDYLGCIPFALLPKLCFAD
jgi:hypothetical protein